MKNNRFNKFLGVLTHNLGLKLLAAIVSCALWFIVNNITDPIDEIPFYNIPVEIVNADSVVNEGKIYEVLDGTDTVNVQVKGKTSVLNGITRDDIRAVADLSQITFLNTVQIEVSSKRNNSDLDFKSNIQNMKLAIEDVKRIQLIINPSTVGSPAEGYVVGNVSSSQNIVRLQGPESLIQSINRVEAVANIDGYSSDINTSVELKLYDNEGTEIKSDSITMNISTVNVAVTILAVKEVPINVTFADTPAEGYISSGKVVCVPEKVMLAGRRSVLDSISALNISDPLLTLKDKDKDVTTIINIKKYLPSGIQFADQLFSGNISVTAGIEPITTKKLEIPVRNFAAGNKPDDMD
ncbi:MAG: CdaR family protein, partial [Lachnospiraceae bacterium]|nr:CdaR family protein [Lachnospiraceae bacterium]